MSLTTHLSSCVASSVPVGCLRELRRVSLSPVFVSCVVCPCRLSSWVASCVPVGCLLFDASLVLCYVPPVSATYVAFVRRGGDVGIIETDLTTRAYELLPAAFCSTKRRAPKPPIEMHDLSGRAWLASNTWGALVTHTRHAPDVFVGALVSSIRQRSIIIKWLVCTVIVVTELSGLIQLVGFSQNVIAKEIFQCWHQRVVPARVQACHSQWFFYVPNWDWTDINLTRSPSHDESRHDSLQCWIARFYLKYHVPTLSVHWTRSAGVPGGCANHFTTARHLAAFHLFNIIQHRLHVYIMLYII